MKVRLGGGKRATKNKKGKVLLEKTEGAQKETPKSVKNSKGEEYEKVAKKVKEDSKMHVGICKPCIKPCNAEPGLLVGGCDKSCMKLSLIHI